MCLVVFGNDTVIPLVTLSRQCVQTVEQATTNVAQWCVVLRSRVCVCVCVCVFAYLLSRHSLLAYWDYFTAARALFIDQISSRSLGNTPLQGLLQSNARFRCDIAFLIHTPRLTESLTAAHKSDTENSRRGKC